MDEDFPLDLARRLPTGETWTMAAVMRLVMVRRDLRDIATRWPPVPDNTPDAPDVPYASVVVPDVEAWDAADRFLGPWLPHLPPDRARRLASTDVLAYQSLGETAPLWWAAAIPAAEAARIDPPPSVTTLRALAAFHDNTGT